MKNFILHLLLLLGGVAAFAEPTTPDFAFPKTVASDASKALKRNLDEKKYIDALQNCIQLTIADNIVDRNNVLSTLARLDSVANIIPSQYRALARLISARIYTDVYLQGGASSPLAAIDSTISIPKKVLCLVRDARILSNSAPALPLQQLSPLLTSVEAAPFIPDSRSFINYYSLSLLSYFQTAASSPIIPFRINSNSSSPISSSSPLHAEIDSISLATLQTDQPNPRAFAMAQRTLLLPDSARVGWLEECLKMMEDTPQSVMLLHQLATYKSPSSFLYSSKVDHETIVYAQQFYARAKKTLVKFPDATDATALQNDLTEITRQQLRTSALGQFTSAMPVEIKTSICNTSNFNLLLFSLPHSDPSSLRQPLSKLIPKAHLVKSIPITTGIDSIGRLDTTINLGVIPFGFYIAIPSLSSSVTGIPKNILSDYPSFFRISNLSILSASDRSEKPSNALYIVDAISGKPLKNIKVEFISNRANQKNQSSSALTDFDGRVTPPSVGSLTIRLSNGQDVNYFNEYFSTPRTSSVGSPRPGLVILTDRQVCRPGDSIGFVAVSYLTTQSESSLQPNTKIKLELRDANNTLVTTTEGQTDSTGRFSHYFIVPDDGLLGNWSIGATNSRAYFQVADYKLPSFFVDVDSVASATGNNTLIRIAGKALSYSGLPVSNANVSFSIRYVSRWFRYNPGLENASFAGQTTTDSQGIFSIDLDTSMLKDTPFAFGAYQLNIDVTAPDGETRSAPSQSFAIGSAWQISPSIPARINLSDNKQPSLAANVTDILGKPTSRLLHFTLSDINNKVIDSGNFISPQCPIDLSKLKSGKYSINFYVVDDSTSKAESSFILYRLTDARPPIDSRLWLPYSSITAKPEQKQINIPVGSSAKDSYILTFITSDSLPPKAQWLKIDARNSSVKVDAPMFGHRTWVSFATMADTKGYSQSVEILPAEANDKLTIHTQSFRDKLTPGETESWQFSFLLNGKPAQFTPAIAVLTDLALDDIAPLSWKFNPYKPYFSNPLSLSHTSVYSTNNSFLLDIKPYLQTPPAPSVPEWNTFGYSLFPSDYAFTRRYKMRSAGATSNGVVVQEEMADYAAPMMLAASKTEATLETDEGNEESQSDPLPAQNYLRDSSMPVAFFRPMLTSDASGSLSLSFNVPNFNTTWKLQIIGYTDRLLSASTTLEATAVKPVIVRTNNPRFLRTGDMASISANLANSSSDSTLVSGRIEVIDPISGVIIAKFNSEEEWLEPKANRVISLPFSVPDSVSCLLIRSFASSSLHTDGEQTLIPVLPSSTPIIQSVGFYLAPSQTQASIKLPNLPSGANVTIQYCDNPIWYVLTALPSITTPQSKNILSLIRAYYANSTLIGLLNRYPQVASRLSDLLKQEPSSPLASNSDLKSFDLINTPWVNDAAAEAARMRALATLAQNPSANFNALLRDILALQNSNGAWSWCPGMPSSSFMTHQVISRLGMLKANGFLQKNKNLDTALRKALTFIDDQMLKSDQEYPKRLTVDNATEWLYLHYLLPGLHTPNTSLQKKTIRLLNSQWRSLSLPTRAKAAMILQKAGYSSNASLILESLRQLAVYSPQKGMRYENLHSGYNGTAPLLSTAMVLQAFTSISPQSESVSRLSQGLILQRQTENWGADPYTLDVIQAIIMANSNWLEPNQSPTISINGNKLTSTNLSSSLYSCDFNLSSTEASEATLSISRQSSNGPAWGSIIAQYIEPMADVKATPGPGISVRKDLFRVQPDRLEPITENDVLLPGDKIKVVLTITTDRDMDYVALADARSACLEPIDQLSGYSCVDGIWLYREIRDEATNFFISFLPKGTHSISYDNFADRAGTYSLGLANAQSQYAPQITAHSAGKEIKVNSKK